MKFDSTDYALAANAFNPAQARACVTASHGARGFSTVREVSKWQAVRLFDVFLLGPFMIAAGATHRSRKVRALLIAAGIGTIALNGFNWLQQQENLK